MVPILTLPLFLIVSTGVVTVSHSPLLSMVSLAVVPVSHSPTIVSGQHFTVFFTVTKYRLGQQGCYDDINIVHIYILKYAGLMYV